MAGEIKTVAVLGTGIIGAPVARHLAEAGFDVRAWNRTREKAEALAEHGVSVSENPSDAAEGADALLTVLSDGEAVESVVESDGVLAALAEGAVWAQVSTVGLTAADRLEELAGAAEVPFVDAPVLGTKEPAEAGQLVVLASGEAEQLDRCGPLFDAYGARTVRLGAAGSSSRMKLVLNDWLLALTAGVAEAIGLAEALDVSPESFLEIIDGNPIGPAYAQIKGKKMIERDFATSFPLYLALKDARLVLEAADTTGHEARLAEAVERLYEQADAQGNGDLDMSAVYEAVSGRDDERPAAAP